MFFWSFIIVSFCYSFVRFQFHVCALNYLITLIDFLSSFQCFILCCVRVRSFTLSFLSSFIWPFFRFSPFLHYLIISFCRCFIISFVQLFAARSFFLSFSHSLITFVLSLLHDFILWLFCDFTLSCVVHFMYLIISFLCSSSFSFLHFYCFS